MTGFRRRFVRIHSLWVDEATFNLKDTVKRKNCVYRSPENRNVYFDTEVNLPGTSLRCDVLSHLGMLWDRSCLK